MVSGKNGWLSAVDQRRRRASGQNRPGSAKDKGLGCILVSRAGETGPERRGSTKDKGLQRALT